MNARDHDRECEHEGYPFDVDGYWDCKWYGCPGGQEIELPIVILESDAPQVAVDRKSYTIAVSVGGNVLASIPVERVESFAVRLNDAVAEARSAFGIAEEVAR